MRLADWLKANGRTASWLAGQVGRDPSFIIRVKNGDAMPSIELAADIQRLTDGHVTALDYVRTTERVAPPTAPVTDGARV